MEHIARRIAHLWVEKLAFEFDNQKQLNDYLHDHPNADHKKHWVAPAVKEHDNGGVSTPKGKDWSHPAFDRQSRKWDAKKLTPKQKKTTDEIETLAQLKGNNAAKSLASGKKEKVDAIFALIKKAPKEIQNEFGTEIFQYSIAKPNSPEHNKLRAQFESKAYQKKLNDAIHAQSWERIQSLPEDMQGAYRGTNNPLNFMDHDHPETQTQHERPERK